MRREAFDSAGKGRDADAASGSKLELPGRIDQVGPATSTARLIVRWKAVRPFVETDVYTIIPRAIVARTIVAALPPAAERPFHIAELASNSRGIPFSPLENLFCIAKIATHPIEKQGKFMSYVLYKTSPKAHRAALLFSHAVRFDIRAHAQPFTQTRFALRRLT